MLEHSLAGSVWTAISRMTGLARGMTVAAVLGATYLGNTYQAINSLPNLIYYQLLSGSLFASLLVPALVPYADRGDAERVRSLVGGFLGVLVAAGLVMSGVLLVAGRSVLRLLVLGVGNATVATSQTRVGWLLLLMFLPQILLYIVAGTGAAVMNAHGRFALAAGAPAVESVGIIGLMAAAAVVFGTGTALGDLPTAELLMLGIGTTSAVALHAAFQWAGARRVGVALVPRAGWSDPEVRKLVASIVPTLGYTSLAALQILAVLVVANRIPGGLVAFQLALNFFYLPTAIVTWPVARALLPRLSRRTHDGDDPAFATELARGVALVSFLTVPIAVAYFALAFPIARAVAFGQLGTVGGERMVALSLASLATAVVGEGWFVLGTYAFFARRDPRSALVSMAVRVVVSLAVMAVAWRMRGPGVLVMLGVALSAGSLAGAAHMAVRLRARLPRPDPFLLRSIGRTGAGSVMVVPAYLTAVALGRLPRSQLSEVLIVFAAAVVGAGAFIALQAAWHAPELGLVKNALFRFRTRGRRK
jgi:putative peptidoglycan lipid II flippase